MIIKDMFYKGIDREINGVIKVGQKDKENVYQELDEYVVTEELNKYMNRFFDAYKRGLTGRTDKMGVWISGFFGSGKSHFLKILSYILSDKVVVNPEDGTEHTASSFFLDGAKVTTFVTNNGNGTADVKTVMVGNDGNTYYQDYIGMAINSDDFLPIESTHSCPSAGSVLRK